jgi:hypothetical protein
MVADKQANALVWIIVEHKVQGQGENWAAIQGEIVAGLAFDGGPSSVWVTDTDFEVTVELLAGQ